MVGQAADGADAVRQARHLQPYVVLLDVRIPVMDGLQATREILRAAASPDRPRVLMLTTFHLDDYLYRALRAGASGLLLKDATSAGLIQAVRVIGAGTSMDFSNGQRAPLLLLIVDGRDRIFPVTVTRSTVERYRQSTAVTAHEEFPERSHFTIGEPGGERVADYVLRWAIENALTQT